MSVVRQDHRVAVRLDLAERLVLAALFSYFTVNIAADFVRFGQISSLLLLVSEGLVVVLVALRRRTADISLRPRDWLLAVAGTSLPLLARSGGEAIVPGTIVVAMMVCGIILQIGAKLYLRRSFGIVPANRGVCVGGPYRVVRHPMYAGYIAAQLGFLLANPTAWNLGIYAASWLVQLGRILAEERLLMRDSAYRSFAAAVPYRLIPGVF